MERCASITGSADRDQVFGRLTHFHEAFVPVTPLPDGSGVTSGTLGPQDTTSWAFASSYQRTFSAASLNELRFGDTRRTVARTAAQLRDLGVRRTGHAGHSVERASFPNTLPTFLIGGYQQLGSPPNTATDFGTSVTEIADTLTWLKGRHTLKAGFDLRWERLERHPAAVADRLVHVQQPLHAICPAPPTPARRSPASCSARCSSSRSTCSRTRSGTAPTSRSTSSRTTGASPIALTINAGLRYTLNFPSTEDQRPGGGLQSRDASSSSISGGRQPRAARQLHKNNFGPRLGIVGRLTDKTVVSAGYGLVWIEMAGITTPFTTPVFPFLQTVSQRTLDNISPAFVLANGPERRADCADADRRPRTGRVRGRSRPRLGLRAAVERVGAARADREHLGRGRLRRIEDHPRRHPRHQPQSADRRAAGAGRVAPAARAESVLRHHPAVVVARRSDDHRGPAAQAVSAVHDGQPVSQQRRHDDLPRRLRQAGAAAVARALVSRQLHALEADGRRLVGVRRVDPDRAGRQLPGGRQLQPHARARLLDRRHSARLRGVGGLGPAVRRGTAPSRHRACSARSSTTGR